MLSDVPAQYGRKLEQQLRKVLFETPENKAKTSRTIWLLPGLMVPILFFLLIRKAGFSSRITLVSGCPFVAGPESMSGWITQTVDGTFPQISQQEKRDFLRLLNRTSYAGLPYEAYMVRRKEFEKVLTAVRSVL